MNQIATISLFAFLAIAPLACEQTSAPTMPTAKSSPRDAANTANNAADRASGTKTPMDQSQSPADIKITADIRSALVGDKSMSTDAKNCKVITEQGVVTLRGVVASQAEKDAIEAIARKVVAVLRVDNQLEVKSS